MTTNPNAAYKELLDSSNKNQLTYAILRDDLNDPNKIKDLDLLLDANHLQKFEKIAAKHGFICIKDGYLNPGKRVYLKYTQTGTYLVDLHTRMVCRGLTYMNARQAIEQRIQRNGFYYLNEEDTWFALLFHNILAKKCIQPKHQQAIVSGLHKYRQSKNLKMKATQFGLASVFKAFCTQYPEKQHDTKWLKQLHKNAKRALFYRPENLITAVGVFYRKLRIFLVGFPKGRTVAFLGPDGAGKSTTIKAIRQRLKEIGLNTKVAYMGPWGGSILKLRKLFFWLNPSPYRSDYKLYFEGKRNDKPGKLSGAAKWKFKARSGLYYVLLKIEMWARWRFRVLPALREGRIVLADRYIYDILTGYKNRPMDYDVEKRENICQKYPAPDVGILLDSDPQIILARKPQLEKNQLDYARLAYQQIAQKFNFITLDTSDSVENTLRDFEAKILPKILN